MKKNILSVVLAVYNEENNLTECLKSIKDIADEIVVVDGGSTDNTVVVAKNFNSIVIKTNNPPNFHINKNKAINVASGEWILQLDADEVVSKELLNEIKKVVNTKSNINGYWIPRRNFFLGRFLKKGGQYPDYTLRLYRKGFGRLPAKDVHEQAVVDGKTGYFKNDLLHMRDKTFSIYIERFNRYTNLLASQLKEVGVKISVFSFVNYMVVRPLVWFIKVYFRNRGYVDGFPGFVFVLFSSLRFPVAYIKLWSNRENSS